MFWSVGWWSVDLARLVLFSVVSIIRAEFMALVFITLNPYSSY